MFSLAPKPEVSMHSPTFPEIKLSRGTLKGLLTWSGPVGVIAILIFVSLSCGGDKKGTCVTQFIDGTTTRGSQITRTQCDEFCANARAGDFDNLISQCFWEGSVAAPTEP